MAALFSDPAVVDTDYEMRAHRMRPFAEACEGLDRAVRDLARASGKTVELRRATGHAAASSAAG